MNKKKGSAIAKEAVVGAIVFSLLAGSGATWSMASAQTAQAVSVKAVSLSGAALNMWTTISSPGATKTGFTPMSFAADPATAYTITMADYGSNVFDHWDNGSTSRSRSVALGTDMTVTAYYKRDSVNPPPLPPPPVAKTGVYVALYMYPSGTGATWWQKVIDEKSKHPSVPIVAAFNPNSGPGSFKDNNIATWVAKLKSAGVTAIGYTYDNYGARSLTALKADADKYKNWYNADGLFIDEFTNKVGYEQHYRDLTTYAKSIGMKMTFGNPGTDVPKSYIGTIDVINITEGKGYMPISWLQYCVLCSSSSGWHYQYDKRNFAYIRYDISSLDTSFEVNSSQWVGLLYITSGNDSNGRWFSLPSYFSTEVATLDR